MGYLPVAVSGAQEESASGRCPGVGGVSAAGPGAPDRLGDRAALAASPRAGGEAGGRRAGLGAGRGRPGSRESERGRDADPPMAM